MYPKNAASPERVEIGPVVLIADGTVQTSGVSVKVIPQGGAEASGGGTIAYSADGIVLYTPTQAETNYTSFILIASKTGCIPASKTIVTSAESTAGTVKTGSIATNAVNAAALASDAVTKIQAGLSTLDAAAVRTAIGLASANIDTQLAGINAKTTNLPSDPADASDIAAAFATVNSTLATIAGYLDTEIAAIKAKTDTLPASPASETTLSALSGKLAGITLLKNWLAVIMGKVADTTTRAEVNATTAGVTYNETTDSLEAIRDRGDAAWTTGGGGGGGDATAANQTTIINHLTDIKGAGWSSTTDTLEKIRDAITAALDSVIASVGVTPGALTGWPETMSIGDSYTDDCSRSIHLLVRDSGNTPITSIGSHAFTDADFTATVILSQGAQRGRVIGTATWVVGPEGYLNVQIPSKESRRAAEGTATVQVLLRWTNSGDQYTLPAATTRWVAQL